MNKLCFLISLMIFIIPITINAEELLDITADIEIRTKWYREQEVGKYHPKGEELPGYTENPDKITYSEYYTAYSSSNCLLSSENYLIHKMNLKKYQIVTFTKYIKLTNFKYHNNIAVFNNGKKVNFSVFFTDDNQTILEFTTALPTENLHFFIDYDTPYNITLSLDKEFTEVSLSKDITGEKVLIPDKTWITSETNFYTTSSETLYSNNGLITYLGSSDTCKAKQIYTYRYKIEREYYDDEYHSHVEGYIPDMTDIKVYYQGEELIKTVEVPVYEKVTEYITKYQTIEVPKEIIKTIEVSSETVPTESETITSKSNECNPQVVTEVQYVDKVKEVSIIPKYIFYTIVIMFIIMLIIISYLIKKYVTR